MADHRSLVSPPNFANFLLLMKFYLPALLAGRPAAIVEFGVARGGCLLFLAALARWLLPASSRVWGFDTFEGIPPGGAELDALAVLAAEIDVASRRQAVVERDEFERRPEVVRPVVTILARTTRPPASPRATLLPMAKP